jgi:hypothetical protein
MLLAMVVLTQLAVFEGGSGTRRDGTVEHHPAALRRVFICWISRCPYPSILSVPTRAGHLGWSG